MTKLYNFSAGPAMLPVPVMEQAQAEFLDWNGTGCSVLEVSHRGDAFLEMAHEAERDLRELMAVPDNYRTLFMHGGGRGQFSAVPQNIASTSDSADYLDCGIWSGFAIREAEKYLASVNRVAGQVDTEQGRAIAAVDQWHLNPRAAYFHYCPNETVDGVALHEIPDVEAPLVADMSSNILSEPLDVSRFGVIYAGAQKNIGPSGFAIAIVREDLLGAPQKSVSTIMDYTVQAADGSMYNTPNTFAWYLAGLVFKWLKQQGGVAAMGKLNRAKAEHLYGYIDNSGFYSNPVHPAYRSIMNVPFLLADDALNATFLSEAEQHGLVGLKGHRFVGGMRASIYNAMPMAGVEALVSFMQDFEQRYG